MSKLNSLRSRLRGAVERWFSADEKLDALVSGGDGSERKRLMRERSAGDALGRPCREPDLRALEKSLGRKLPEGYRAYLSLFGRGKKDFGAPLGPDEQQSGGTRKQLAFLNSLFTETGERNPLEQGALPFIIEGDSWCCSKATRSSSTSSRLPS